MFKVNNKDIRTTPLASYFATSAGVFIVNFEKVIAGWVIAPELLRSRNPPMH